MGGRDYPGREILGAGSARSVLERLMDGDPLEIGPRCQERIEHHAILVAWDRLWLRSAARIAYSAPTYDGTPPLDLFLMEHVDLSIDELIEEDREEENAGQPPLEPWDPRYSFLAETVGMEPALARKACIRFNDLPEAVRRTYFAVALARKTIHRWVAEGHGPPHKVKEDLKRAFAALSLPFDGYERFERGGDA
jgi:hypothetical protein